MCIQGKKLRLYQIVNGISIGAEICIDNKIKQTFAIYQWETVFPAFGAAYVFDPYMQRGGSIVYIIIVEYTLAYECIALYKLSFI